jgi:hypothetical protein
METSTSEQELVSLSSLQRQIPLLQGGGSQTNLHVGSLPAVVESLDLPKIKGTAVLKRGPSYSDSFLLTSPTVATFFLQDIGFQPLAAPAPERGDASTQTDVPETKRIGAQIFKKIGSFLFHIFLISIFENIFFFTFISKSEDQGILKTVGNYVDDFAESCATWPQNETVFWNDLLSLVINPLNVSAASEVSLTQRNVANESLFVQSWLYTSGVLATVCLGGLLGWRRGWLSRRTVKRILLENIGLVAMLGLYEYIFFRTIIYEYTSLSVDEIDEYAVGTLQQRCGLFLTNYSADHN